VPTTPRLTQSKERTNYGIQKSREGAGAADKGQKLANSYASDTTYKVVPQRVKIGDFITNF
jgi:hypothetical protein